MNRKKIWYLGLGVILLGLALFFWNRSNNKSDSAIVISPKHGTFEINLKTSGELVAKNSKEIEGPSSMRKAGLHQIKITDLIPEGTNVEKGDYVATLDKSELQSKLIEADLNVRKFGSQVETEKLDCTLTLSQAREELINLKYGLEQKKLTNEESKFEPPATQRQAEIEFEKADRALSQATENYQTKVKQATAKMRIAESELQKAENSLKDLFDLQEEFTIVAPEKGMVIYDKEWSGKKRVVGSTISMWDPTVATLPDFSIMESVTRVNEVDIQKIKVDQKVEMGLDSDPSKKLVGTVTSVANIGEDAKGTDSKVFEVRILVETQDSNLRPAMTTSNVIHISKFENVTYIPLEALHSVDSITFVYLLSGLSMVRQEVKLGERNENEIIISSGLKPEDKIQLNAPKNGDKFELKRL